MTLEEFSNGFDVLIDSYRRFKNFDERLELDSLDFNEYEKSLFLTKSQDDLILGLYNGKNVYGDSFEKTEEIRRYLSNLIVTETLELEDTLKLALSEYSKFFKLNDEVLFLTYEAFIVQDSVNKCNNGKILLVLPVSLDELHRIINNPFRGINSRRALRLDVDGNNVEIISKYDGKYQVRYLRKPNPIILINLPQGLSINRKSKVTGCELSETLHNQILDGAVRLALASKGYNINNK